MHAIANGSEFQLMGEVQVVRGEEMAGQVETLVKVVEGAFWEGAPS